MLFSIVVPVYGVEKYIHRCVDSILNQTYTDFELILVDDGSKDNCPKILDEYAEKDQRIKVIHKENGGLVSARKAGVAVASGEYIVSIDGDDWVKENYLEVFAEAINNKPADVVCCGWIIANPNKNIERKVCVKEGYYDRERLNQKIMPILLSDENGNDYPTMHWAKAIKRELLSPVLFAMDDRIIIGEDITCIVPCIYKCKDLYVMAESTYYYRYNPTSLTKSKKAFNMYEPKMRYQLIESQVDEITPDFRAQIYRATVHSLFNTVISQFHRQEKSKVVKGEIKKVLEDDYYKKAIKNCKYKKFSYRLMKFALKHRLYFLMKLYLKIK